MWHISIILSSLRSPPLHDFAVTPVSVVNFRQPLSAATNLNADVIGWTFRSRRRSWQIYKSLTALNRRDMGPAVIKPA